MAELFALGLTVSRIQFYTSAQQDSIDRIRAQLFACLVSFKEGGMTAELCCHRSQ